MKRLYTSILLTMLMSMIGTMAFAHDFAVDNKDGVTIYYVKTSDTEVAVTFQGPPVLRTLTTMALSIFLLQ